ncbi:MAG: MBL fold metallo-hydrolase [Syntrophorhabdaceae bacterium]|nr:MBL fold metallo-hydrolase [Syntrophorhabdaceae bacterium]MDD5242659.1 MBL fold metallo-hydrolase [Syntrophorhabdaceae bacterium]
MKLKIHRGTHEIGGSCVEIKDSGTRIVIDIGMPLVTREKEKFEMKAFRDLSGPELVERKVLPDIKGLYEWDTVSRPIDGLLISHAHADHYGFMDYMRDDIRCFLSEGTHQIIELNKSFFGRGKPIKNPIILESGKPARIKTFMVIPYLMDHSAFDALAFLIESKDRRIIYSGDFREHGRKGKAFKWFLENAPREVDALLLEGTMVGQVDRNMKTEPELEEELIEHIVENNAMTLVFQSSQNIDRIVTCFKAARRTGHLFVVDLYTAHVLRTLKNTSRSPRIPYPSHNFPELKVFFPKRLCDLLARTGKKELMYVFKDYKIERSEIAENPQKVVMLVRPSMLGDLKRLQGIQGATVIYSQWQGYFDETPMKKMMDFLKSQDVNIIQLHTSGHAGMMTLKKVVDTIRPETIIPIHTFFPEHYKKFAANVLNVEDGQEISI